ncbi:DNA (cytosine-5-)-methyltransferase [Christensenellaceae bacterium OttesenSCG-928-M15]|nr:DNA (cytosine-5-)-methyltransferase [Christensenellaceae bacterium OttesenSCG-928-M15]
MNNIRYFDLFAGVGGFRSALELIEGTQCVGYCEIDPHAQKSYRALFNTEGEWFHHDATKIDPTEMPEFDLLCGGFPCQSYSASGRQKAFDDPRGQLFFEIPRILGAKKPAMFLLENVPNILSFKSVFATILTAFSDLGYHVEWACYNSKDFGVPQSRNRVFLAGYLDRRCAGKVLPEPRANSAALVQIIPGPQGGRVYDPSGVSCTLSSETGGFGGRTGLYAVGFNRKDGVTKEIDTAYALNASNYKGLNRNQNQNAVVKEVPAEEKHFIDLCEGEPKVTDIARCITAHYGKTTLCKHKGERSGVLEGEIPPLLIKGNVKRGYHEARPGDAVTLSFPTSNKRHTRVMQGLSHTLDTGCQEGVVTLNGRIRRLTPRECFRLQGFREEQIDKILAITSDSQAYKQAGNSVTVPVVHAIASKMVETFRTLKEGDAA